jgi:hypothetical protein
MNALLIVKYHRSRNPVMNVGIDGRYAVAGLASETNPEPPGCIGRVLFKHVDLVDGKMEPYQAGKVEPCWSTANNRNFHRADPDFLILGSLQARRGQIPFFLLEKAHDLFTQLRL